MTILSAILQAFFSDHCFACGRAGVSVCFKCLESSRPPKDQREEWIYPLYGYRGTPAGSAVRILKYQHRRNVAKILAESLYGYAGEIISELYLLRNFCEPLLVPIPISKKRRRERGYNQSELICRELKKISKGGLEMSTRALAKTKETERQARIKNREERKINISESFAVNNPAAIRGQNIILVDDVTTTGATLCEAKKVLLSAGARQIIAFTVAH